MADITLFEVEANQLLQEYPAFQIQKVGDISVLGGLLELKDKEGNIVDVYQIEIHPGNYPNRFPRVCETGGRIPRNIDWHIYESTGHCCLKVPQEEILICNNGISLSEFLKSQVIPYFFNQTFRYSNGYFLNERSHDVKGILEFYFEILKTKNPNNVLITLRYIINNTEPNRVAICFCDSGEKYRKCHRNSFRLLTKLGLDQLIHDFILIGNYIG